MTRHYSRQRKGPAPPLSRFSAHISKHEPTRPPPVCGRRMQVAAYPALRCSITALSFGRRRCLTNTNTRGTRRPSSRHHLFSAAVFTIMASQTTDAVVDVVIVGAGISGLVAASKLHERGLTVAVLEGRDRIGGRCWATPEGADLGASWAGPYIDYTRGLSSAQLERFMWGTLSGSGDLVGYAHTLSGYGDMQQIKQLKLSLKGNECEFSVT